MRRCLFVSLLIATLGNSGEADEFPFEPLGRNQIDWSSIAESVGGRERSLASLEKKSSPAGLIWTSREKNARPEWRGVPYGTGKDTGIRHLRIGLTEALPVGSVLVRGGGVLSVLKPEAAYPGNLNDDSQWQTAERLVDGQVSQQEAGEDDYALWVLPPGTRTRALRFSHSPSPGDREMSQTLGGIWMLRPRLGNVAPQAMALSANRDDVTARIIDGSNNRTWRTWENFENGAPLPISEDHPEFITLTWPKAVTLNGLCLLWCGFSAVDVQAFTGSDSESVRDAPESNWETIATANDLESLYPMFLGPNWIPFDKTVTTRAIRLRVTQGARASHPHLNSKVKDGRRIWLGEVMALSPLRNQQSLADLILPKSESLPPPIPVKFSLPEAGVVTLVIEDEQGNRVRNLVSETPFPAGENIAWWDGSDDLLRDPEAARHGLYHIPRRPVSAGTYKVRGIWHRPLKLHYEFSIYNAGKPAWTTADNTGCWLTTHTPPTSMAFVPGTKTASGEPLIFMGAFVAEGGHGLQWLREDGTKLGGQGWVGGNWTGAPTLAVDLGPRAIPDHLCYVGSVWEGELRLTAKTRNFGDQLILKRQLGREFNPKDKSPDALPPPPVLEGFTGGNRKYVLAGIASYDGRIICSLVRQNDLLVVDVNTGTITSRIQLKDPRGLAFDDKGRLLALSGRKLVRFPTLTSPPETIIDSDLEDPRHIALDRDGNLLITDRGNSHQVKIFTPAGHLVGTIGKAGPPTIGPYDPLHMNNPNQLAVDSQNRVWVAESDNYPRRVSIWSTKGDLIEAKYGPTEYGGGGVLDPQDRTRFYYKGLEFLLDWESGTDQLVRVFARPDPLLDAHYGHFSPDTPLYPKSQPGQRYFTSCYTHNPTGGDDIAFIWRDDKDQAHLVAALGNAHSWPILREKAFHNSWPEGTHPENDRPKPDERVTFAWSDANGDGRPQPEEVQFQRQFTSGVTVMNDLSFVVSRYGDQSVRWPARFDSQGIPHYHLNQPVNLGPAGGRPQSSGGNQTLTESGGWTIHTNAPQPLSPYGLGGVFNGQVRWSYPSAWPGLHASHEAAVPDQPGMVVGHTRLLGGWVNGPAGPMFCVNGNMGNMYLFTADGLFVGTLFHDIRLRPNWAAPIAVRNMDVTDVSLHDENFWPSITQTADGKVYLVDGSRTSLVRVDGLETLRSIPESTITVTPEDLDKAREWYVQAEARRQQQQGSGVLRVPFRSVAPEVDGQLNDWPADTDWAFIDRRGTKANFNSNSRPYEVSSAVALTNTHLYAAWRTTEKDLLTNSGETENALFKHGGCLDLMLATNPNADPKRPEPVEGDLRLLITKVKGQTRALLYRARVPGTVDPVAFSSPWRTITIDQVLDVSDQVQLATDGRGNFEISVPLSVLHWQPQSGTTYRADLGILRGANGQTNQRVYWSNKATAITADVPSEAELMPRLWGKWTIVGD